jgi:hypothetical protein
MPTRRSTLGYLVYVVIQLLYIVINLQLQLEEVEREERRKRLSTLNATDNDLDAVLLSSLPSRRTWALPRSHHWKQMVIDNKTLKEPNEYKKTFRMTQTSFDSLHEMLGVILCLPALI